ncbi:MAG: glycosyltransferase family 9 protein, partial [Alphaproteobacteria bacterium]|nr:glycosyltransferase family 9 protein [Alphaproteobacteria bacterium]
WIGATPGATIRNNSTSGHAFDRHVQTLALAGITNVSLDDLSWMTGTDHDFGIQPPYVLLVPGSAPQRPEKRWPHYAALATQIAAHGFQPVILGSADESALAEQIIAAAPTALNLCGRTQLTDIPALARHAAAAVGNDTGPMHMIAPTGCPALVLFSAHSDPQRHAPRGAHVETLQSPHLQDLTVTQVFKKMEMLSR